MSVGRAQGTHIARDTSLAAHPLLDTPQSLDPAKYVLYTPRHRQLTPAPATPPPTQGSVPAKHQLANLRAAAQTMGLDVASVGWAILDKIAYEGDTSDGWTEIWNALTKTKASLLLPSELSSSQDVVTPDFVQDHVFLCDRDNTSIVTLSGLRGQLLNDSLTFRSTLHRSTKAFQTLWTPSASRTASLEALPPLPAIPSESSYPSCTVSMLGTTLPLPPKATKPPLPPRPAIRGAPPPSAARLPMPFATLFGRPSTPPPPPPPAAASATTTTATTTAPSTSTSADIDTPIHISVCITTAALIRSDIAITLLSALKSEIAIALADQPPWLVERVHAFAATWAPFVKVPAGKKKLQDIQVGGVGGAARVVYAVQGMGEEVAERFQGFYRTVEDELRDEVQQVDGQGEDAPTEEKKAEADEVRIREVLETIEATLCTLFYDKLFLPSTSDDASHNEALSSRIAALNMLDLGLEHLDVDIGDADRAEVNAVVRACGETLAELDRTARSPREKAAVVVSAHKLVVDGLSKIPPIRLKSRDDPNEQSLPGPTQATEHVDSPAPSLSVTAAESAAVQNESIPSIHSPAPSNEPSDIGQPSSSEAESSSWTPSPVSGDVLLPILIYSVVKANPPRLVSHLLYMQRFRNQSFGGEESYCLINLMAVAEFLENVDLSALGLSESEKVISTADLSPISLTRPAIPEPPIATVLPDDEHLAGFRGRVGMGVDTIAGSANKVISGVFDSSFGVLRAFLPGPVGVSGTGTGAPTGSGLAADSGTGSTGVASVSSPNAGSTGPCGDADTALVWRPGLGILRRESGFSIAGLTAALPVGAGKARGQGQVEEEGHRELVEVSSRPSSVRSQPHRSDHERVGSEEGEESDEEDGSEEGEEAGEDEAGEGDEDAHVHDTRSIRSFESMLSGGRAKRPKTQFTTSLGSAAPGTTRRRKRLTDLTDRLTHGMAEMSRRVQGGDLQKASAISLNGRLPPPNRRFMECTEQDIRVSEVGELLLEYQRLVESVRSAGGFQE